MTKREARKFHVYRVAPFVRASVLDVTSATLASLRPVVDIYIKDV